MLALLAAFMIAHAPLRGAPAIMPSGEFVRPWHGWTERCQRGACVPASLSYRLRPATLPNLVELYEVNQRINAYPVAVETDGDYWQSIVVAGSGDCEDYALAKQDELVALGWPRAALRLAVVWVKQPNGPEEGHAVLTVDTLGGTFVLDNRTPAVKRWDLITDYRWVQRQSPDQVHWVSIP